MAKEVKVECPSCHSRLDVDVLTGRVMRVTSPDSAGSTVEDLSEKNWLAASGRVDGRIKSGTNKLDESIEREKKRNKELDELFRKANETIDRKQGNHEDS